MKKFTVLALVLSMVVGSLVLVDMASASTVTLRLGHLANEDHMWNKAVELFADEVFERTDGAVKVEVYPNEILGTEREILEGIRLGTTADMTITGETLGNWAPKVSILGAMYLFRDNDHIEAIANGPIGEEIEQDILERANMRVLTWFGRLPRHLTSNKPILTPEDARGLKLRVPNVPFFIRGWQAIGANPSPMAFSEVFTALQQGVMDGQENPLDLIESANFYEVQDYVNLTGHIRQWIYLVIGENQYQRLTDEQKVAIQEAADVAHVFHQDLMAKEEAELQRRLEANGMTFVEVDEAAFREKAESVVYDHFPDLVDIYERIRDTEY